MKPAVFLDRDGTIIKDKGYIGQINKVEFYPFTLDCLKQLQKKFLLFIVTNQSGIAKGIVTAKQVDEVNNFILNKLKSEGINISALYSCPHHRNDNCKCHKPKTLFAELASKDFDIDLKNSFMIGDHPADVEFALNIGAKGIYVLTGHGKKHYTEIKNMHYYNQIKVFRSLKTAIKYISTSELIL